MGWRYQIPLFLQMGLRVVAPDCMGYGRTVSNGFLSTTAGRKALQLNQATHQDAPPYTLADYGFKRVSADVAELARQLGSKHIILGGHDWGGAIVYRIGQYYPELVTHIFSICTPYFLPQPDYIPLSTLVDKSLPNFRYQLHFASGTLEEAIQSPAEIRAFLNGMYGGRGANGEVAFDATIGVFVENLAKLERTRLLDERELEYYTAEYARHGIHGPLNWYRTREVNWLDELQYFFKGDAQPGAPGPSVEQDVLFVLATKDQALKPHMAVKMGERIERLTRKEVDAGHWALWEKPEEVNKILTEWFEGVVFGGKSTL